MPRVERVRRAACDRLGEPSTSGPAPETGECPTALYAGTSCATFLDGCFAPDTTGTCTDTPLRLEWSDGHVIDRNVARPTAGLIAPGETTPCIALAFEPSTSTSTLTEVATGEVLTNQDLGGGAIRITCPAGEVLDATAEETHADNVCRGLACPP